MRLATESAGGVATSEPNHTAEAMKTIEAALEAGARWIDTARAYGESEAIVGEVLTRAPAGITVVTKCGMRSPWHGDGGRWEPDGRASTILRDAEESVRALGRPPDVLLLHAPDPRVPLVTSFRALMKARRAGLARAIGLSNATRKHLDELGGMADEVTAVEVALGAFDDASARGGVVSWCRERGVPLLAHAPLGGPQRARRISRDHAVARVAARHQVSAQAVVLAYLLEVAEVIVPLVGVRRPETAISSMSAAHLQLDARDLEELDARFPGLGSVRRPNPAPQADGARAEVVMIMGIPGSGKTRLAEDYVARGYARLNRDLLGGTLAGIASRLGALLAESTTKVVLDNTYLTRAVRHEVLRVSHAASACVRCVLVDTPLAEAQINCATRMLANHGALLGGDELARVAKRDPGLFVPTTLSRLSRQLERPAADEGFASIEVRPFVRERRGGSAAIVVPIDVLLSPAATPQPDAARVFASLPSEAVVLVYGWQPFVTEAWLGRATAALAAMSGGRAMGLAVCPHADGPPSCWCRPPLPGLFLKLAAERDVDARLSVLLARTAAHRAMARTLGLAVTTTTPASS